MKKDNNDQKLLKFLGRAAISFVAGTVLTPPVAVFIGTYTYGTAKCMEYLVEEEDKKTCRFISDCSIDIATSGLFNCLVGTKSVSLASETTRAIGQQASKEIARNGLTETAKELIVNGKVVSDMQKSLKAVDDFKNNCSTLIESLEQIKHKNHLDNNVNYLESCELCKLEK